MPTHWQVATDYAHTAAGKCFATLASTLACVGQRMTFDFKSELVRCEIDGTTYYVKKYNRGGKALRRFFGRSRVRTEWQNLQYFASLGIPVTPLVAWGEEKQFGFFTGGALVTAEVPQATDLKTLAQQQPELLRNRVWLRSVLQQTAAYTRRLHAHRFAHGNLEWRNVLVSCVAAAPKVFFFDAPAGKHWFGPFLAFRIVKDLALLDRLAMEYLSPRDRMYFLHCYLGVSRLDEAGRKLAEQVIDYNGQREAVRDVRRARKNKQRIRRWKKLQALSAAQEQKRHPPP